MKDSITKIKEALEYIPSDDRETWVQVGMALYHEHSGSEEGFQLWDVWSAKSDKYKEQGMRSQWKSFNGSGITIGTLLYLAKQNGYELNATINGKVIRDPKKPARQHTATTYNELDSVGTEDYIDDMPPDLSIDEIKQHVFSKVNLGEGYAPTAIYRYTNQDNQLLYFRLRVDHQESGDKKILPFSYDVKKNTWVQKEPVFIGLKPLYNLHALNAAPTDEMILFVEGEKCVDIATTLGLYAVTSGAAQSAEKADWLPLKNKRILLWPDNDDAGKQYVDTVLQVLLQVGVRDVEHIDIETLKLPPKGDIADWVVLHPQATKDEILKLPATSLVTSGWTPIKPFSAEVDAREPYPIEALPPMLQDAVQELAQSIQAPIAMLACSALSVLSLAVQGHMDVARDSELSGPTSLYFLVIANSGERKSTCDSKFMKVVDEYEAEQQALGKEDQQDYEAAQHGWELEKKAIDSGAAKSFKKDKSITSDKTDDVPQLLKDLYARKPKSPRIPKMRCSDTTVEALTNRLANKWSSVGLITSEGGIFFGAHAMAKERIMRAFALYNELWSGGRIDIDRRTSDSYTVSDARLTLSIQVQESVLTEFARNNDTLARGSGFWARFLFAAPESTQGTRYYKRPESTMAHNKYKQFIRDILDEPLSLTDEDTLSPMTVTFTPEAAAAWERYHNKVEDELKPLGELVDLSDVGSKIAEQIARVSALLQVLKSGLPQRPDVLTAIEFIEKDTLDASARIVFWHLGEARRLYISESLPEDIVNAQRLEKWVYDAARKHKTHCITRRKIQQYMSPKALRKPAALDASISMLQAHGRIRIKHSSEKNGGQIIELRNELLMPQVEAS